MDPPAVHSDSVTVRFKHEPSHTFEKPNEFWDKLGTTDKDGELVRLIVTEVISFKEVSLVSHGADPFAQVMDKENEEINDPRYANTVYSFTDNSNIHKPHKKNDMELLALLAALSLEESGIKTWDELVAHFNKEPEAAPEVALYQALVAVDENLTPESLTALVENQLPEGAILLEEGQTVLTEDDAATLAKVVELGGLEKVEEQVALGISYVDQVKNKAIADYKLIAGDAADENIINVIKAADLAAAKSFESHYAADVEKNIPLKCNECDSENVSRASHKKEVKKDDTAHNSYKEQRDAAAKKVHRKASDIHKKD